MTKTELRTKKTAATEQSYRSLIESVKDYAIFMMDKKGRIKSWDQGGVKLFGYSRAEAVGKKFSMLFTKDDIQSAVPEADLVAAVIHTRHLDERQYIRKDKTTFWSSGVLTSTMNDSGAHQGFSKIMRNVSEQMDLQRTAVHNSNHDFLTGLPNRNFFERTLIDSLPKTEKGKLLAVFYMDFNNFKHVNDTYGHRIGDLVLIEIAHRLTTSIRKTDLVARFGGDEFVIVAKQLKNKKDTLGLAKKVAKAFNPFIEIEGKQIQTSISIGIALYPIHAKKPADLLHFSDIALYEAKKMPGAHYQFYNKKSLALPIK